MAEAAVPRYDLRPTRDGSKNAFNGIPLSRHDTCAWCDGGFSILDRAQLLVGLSFAFVVAPSVGGGCASHAGSPPPVLNGTYEAVDADPPDGGEPSGPYVSMTFSTPTSEYALWKTECPEGAENPCFESGTFAWNDHHDTLFLTSDAGQVTSLPASALPPDNATSTETALEALRPEANNGSGPLVTPGGAITGNAGVAGGVRVRGQTLTANGSIELVAGRSVRGLRVLLLPFPYTLYIGETTDCFLSNATALGVWYRAHGATTQVMTMGHTPDSIFTALESAKAGGAPFDRVITLAHGGVDGPLWDDGWTQIGLDWPDMGTKFPTRLNADDPVNRAAIAKLGALLQAVTKPTGFIYLGQCQPGNTSEIDPTYSYLQLMACLSGRTTYGTTTESACWDILQRVEKLDGPQARRDAPPSPRLRPPRCPPPIPAFLLRSRARRSRHPRALRSGEAPPM